MALEKYKNFVYRFLMEDYFYGSLFVMYNVIEDGGIPTACFDGFNIRISPKFWNELDYDYRRSLILHECYHSILDHLPRLQGRHPLIWNFATDLAIHAIFKKEGIKIIPGGLYDPRFDDMTAERIYDILMKEAESGGGGDEGDRPGPDGQGEKPGDGYKPGDKGGGTVKVKVKKVAGGKDDVNPYGDIKYDPKNKGEFEKQKADIVGKTMIAKKAGKLPGNLSDIIGVITAPKMDWKHLLAEFVTKSKDDYSFMKYNPRSTWSPGDVIYPSLESEEFPEVVVILDTSGSISEEEASIFLSEVRGILAHTSVHVLQCDTQVYDLGALKKKTRPKNMKIHGRGGTDFRPPFDYMKKKRMNPAAVVYFTDGECCSFPDKPAMPVMWLVYNVYNDNVERNFPNGSGKIIRIRGLKK